MTGDLIDEEQGGFRAGRGYVDQIFTLKQIGEKAREKKAVYVGFIDMEKSYNRVNKEALWQVLRIYDVGGKYLSGIKSMYVDSLACVRVRGGESEQFRINSGVRQGCIMSPWLFKVYMDAVMKEVKMGIRKEGREWRLSGLLYADGLILCGESEEELRATMDDLLRCVGE